MSTKYIRVKVIPKSPKNEIVGVMEDCHSRDLCHSREGGNLCESGNLRDQTLKIRIKAPPEKGKANAELIKFLSGEMNVPKENIEIISGKTDHIKLLRISV